jgi:hypothetical protein
MAFANMGFQVVERSEGLVTSTKYSHFSNHPNGLSQASLSKTANLFGLGSLMLEEIEKRLVALNEMKNLCFGVREGLRGYVNMSWELKYSSEDRPAPYNS